MHRLINQVSLGKLISFPSVSPRSPCVENTPFRERTRQEPQPGFSVMGGSWNAIRETQLQWTYLRPGEILL